MQLVATGTIWDLFPWAIGDWNEDKRWFVELYLNKFKK